MNRNNRMIHTAQDTKRERNTLTSTKARPGSSVGCASDWYSGGFDHLVRQHYFMKTGHEIISTANLSLPLIQA